MSMFSLRSRLGSHIDVAGTGFTVLDRIYADGSLTEETLGGSCGNVLVSLAMLDRSVAPVLALGDDDEGNRLFNEFSQAGAVTHYIARYSGLRSPVLTQQLDTTSGQHDFSFVCPETQKELPRYQPIGDAELACALPALTHCSVFYADRLSDNILKAMRAARSAGAIIYFEPSEFKEGHLFDEALSLVSILKYSEDRLGDQLAGRSTECVRIVTHGAAGLEVRDKTDTFWRNAISASQVLDTCGAGDMVSIGVIDWLLSNRFETVLLSATHLLDGIMAGQRLAAENCAYAGARGLFKKRGAKFVRKILSNGYSAAAT